MKTLLLMRHAKSSWDDPDLDDHDRPLNKRGLRDVPRMAAWLMHHALVPDSVTSSTAVRAESTARIVAETCGLSTPVQTTDDLYHADLAAWRLVIRRLPRESQRAMCVGHNPGIESLVSTLTETSVHMPTAAVAVVALSVDDWSQFDLDDPGRNWKLWRPKDLPDADPNDPGD